MTYHLPVYTPLLQKLLVVALLQELAFTKHKDDVGILYRGEAVRHHNHGATLAGALKGCLYQLLAFGIQRAGGLVEKQNVGAADQRASNGNALFLTSGECHTSGANVCVVSFR